MQDACQHLDRGGFARAVRTDEAQQLTRLHLEREPAHRFDGAVLRLEQGAHRAAHPGGFALGLEGLVEIGDFDGGHFINTKGTKGHEGFRLFTKDIVVEAGRQV